MKAPQLSIWISSKAFPDMLGQIEKVEMRLASDIVCLVAVLLTHSAAPVSVPRP
jgi:hypothetical protein